MKVPVARRLAQPVSLAGVATVSGGACLRIIDILGADEGKRQHRRDAKRSTDEKWHSDRHEISEQAHDAGCRSIAE